MCSDIQGTIRDREIDWVEGNKFMDVNHSHDMERISQGEDDC